MSFPLLLSHLLADKKGNHPGEMSMRSSPRYPTSEEAEVEIYGQMGHFRGKMKNLSLTGALLELEQAARLPQKGDLIRATVDLPHLGKKRTLDAEIIWTQGLGFGICFIKKEELLKRMFDKSTFFKPKEG